MIKYFRPMVYDKTFFSTGLSVRQGLEFPLAVKDFAKSSRVVSTPYWRKVLGSSGIVPSNLSYAKLED